MVWTSVANNTVGQGKTKGQFFPELARHLGQLLQWQ